MITDKIRAGDILVYRDLSFGNRASIGVCDTRVMIAEGTVYAPSTGPKPTTSIP